MCLACYRSHRRLGTALLVLGLSVTTLGCASNPVLSSPAPTAIPPIQTDLHRTTLLQVDPRPNDLRADIAAFVAQVAAAHDFDLAVLTEVFQEVELLPDVVALMEKPAEKKPWDSYRSIFVTPARVRGGVAFWRTHRDALDRAERTYGVPPEIVTAIIGVETSYGANTGSFRVIDALATLAFDYPRRAEYFTAELEKFLVLARELDLDPRSPEGSYAGAMGLGQFMPSSYLNYAVDFDQDGTRDLFGNPVDAIGSVANYLAGHGWTAGGPVAAPASIRDSSYQQALNRPLKPEMTLAELARLGVAAPAAMAPDTLARLASLDSEGDSEYWLTFDNFHTITSYNRSVYYAMAVYQLSLEIAEAHRTTPAE